jgi:hypothetical protein
MEFRACYLSQILIDESSTNQFIYLSEVDGTRRIPILIGPLEAGAIDRVIKKQSFPRPLTHDLLVTMLSDLGAADPHRRPARGHLLRPAAPDPRRRHGADPRLPALGRGRAAGAPARGHP